MTKGHKQECPKCGGGPIEYDDGMPDRGEATCRWNPKLAVFYCPDCEWSKTKEEDDDDYANTRFEAARGN